MFPEHAALQYHGLPFGFWLSRSSPRMAIPRCRHSIFDSQLVLISWHQLDGWDLLLGEKYTTDLIYSISKFHTFIEVQDTLLRRRSGTPIEAIVPVSSQRRKNAWKSGRKSLGDISILNKLEDIVNSIFETHTQTKCWYQYSMVSMIDPCSIYMERMHREHMSCPWYPTCWKFHLEIVLI